MAYHSETVHVVTNSSGSATAYSNKVSGKVVSVRYAKTDFAVGVDFDITTEDSGQVIWNEENVNDSDHVYPVRAVDDVNGTEIAGTYTRIEVFDERVKIAIANGGDTKAGTFEILIDNGE